MRLFDLIDGLSSETVLIAAIVLLVVVSISDRLLERRWFR